MLRDFQVIARDGVYDKWQAGHRNVMLVSATGSGKTVILGDIIKAMGVPGVAIAHRQELVGQLSLALNRERVPHAIIAPKEVQRQIIATQIETHGHTMYSPQAPTKVAGVHTLIARDAESWHTGIQLAIVDEGHHVLADNIWGRALALFPNSRGLFPTAHAVRADGKGLGRGADGLVDALVCGPSCRDLIRRGYLTDYRLIAPPADINLSSVHVGASGEFVQAELRAAVHASSRIVGDVVRSYQQFAAGKLGLTFAVDIEAAGELSNAYNAAGVPSAVISAETPIFVRAQLMRQFRARQLLQLVSVDVLGEGTDVPALEVVSMARPTNSFQLYAQQFGRALRPMLTDYEAAQWGVHTDQQRLDLIARGPKPAAIILDHVHNWERHNLPDVPRAYSLARRDKRNTNGKGIPLRACVNCFMPYEAVLSKCPHCGHPKPPPQSRGSPEAVEGDLVELDPEVLKALRGEIARIDNAAYAPKGATPVVMASVAKNHRERKEAQRELRATMAVWGGWQIHQGHTDEREQQRRFWHRYHVDVLTAQTLGAGEAEELRGRIIADMDAANIVELVT